MYYFAVKDGKEVIDVLGPSYAETLKAVHHYLTDVDDEFRLVAAVVYLAIGPQLLTYLLSGLSGSATPPKFVRQIGTIAIWSVIKFVAALSGILLAEPVARLSLGTQISVLDFLQGTAMIALAFILAAIQHQYLDREFEMSVMPGFRIHVRVPMLLPIHKFLTKHNRRPAMLSGAQKQPSEWEWPVKMPGLIVNLRGPIPLKMHDLLLKHYPQIATSLGADTASTPKPDSAKPGDAL